MVTMRCRIAVFLMLAMVIGVSAGCGQKGDLYLPDKSDKQQDYDGHARY